MNSLDDVDLRNCAFGTPQSLVSRRLNPCELLKHTVPKSLRSDLSYAIRRFSVCCSKTSFLIPVAVIPNVGVSVERSMGVIEACIFPGFCFGFPFISLHFPIFGHQLFRDSCRYAN